MSVQSVTGQAIAKYRTMNMFAPVTGRNSVKNLKKAPGDFLYI